MKRHAHPVSLAPTPGPWEIEEEQVVYRHWRYAGWPNFGRIIVARLDGTWPQGPERQANLRLIVAAVNACFVAAPASTIVAATALSDLVAAARDGLVHEDDPNLPLEEFRARLRRALDGASGGAR